MKRKTTEKLLILTLIWGTILYGCTYDNESELYGLGTCDTTDVSFSITIEPIIVTNCAIEGCHVPGTGRFLLTDYVEIKKNVDNGSVGRHAIRDRDMPPDGPLPICEINQLASWIEAGAPNN